MALVVIGGVAAGLSAAARARRIDSRLDIVVLEKGAVISYGACGLPFFIEGRIRDPRELMVYTPEYFRKERNITVRTGARVVSIAHPRREVALETGERIRYDKLILATGARAGTAGITGASQPHVFRLHTYDDAIRLKAVLTEKRPKRAVVIGAGYVGVEAADALRRNGLAVTLLERGPDALLRDDPALTAALRRQLERHGVEFLCGAAISTIEPDHVAGVPCDLVVLATGFTPNVEVAGEAGIELGRTGAIRVSDRMETNLLGVYAAGDCAETTHLVSGRPAYVPLGTTANKMGRVAGANAAGARERFPGVAGTMIVGAFGMAFATTGFSAAQARAEGFSPVAARVEAPVRPRYYQSTFGAPKSSMTTVELIADRPTRRLIGGTVIGEDGAAGRIDVIATALSARLKVEDFEQLDLAYSPPFTPVWDPLLVAAQQLIKQF
jgi:NADPH-dependent 2,4-dienoyl-CoA reductase/sulfur reductase-like enzyme